MRIAVRSLMVVTLSICLSGLTVFAADPQRPGLAEGANTSGRKKIVFLSGKPSHGYGEHEQYAGCMLLAKALNENVPEVEAVVYKWNWPDDSKALDGAAAIIIFCDGGGGHMAIPHLDQLSALMDKGVGLGCLHYAVEVPKGKPGDAFLKWIGGYFEANWSINPHWTATFSQLPQNPVTQGVHPFTTNDEWYYHMRFRDEMKDVSPILSAVPTPGLRGSDAAHNGTPEIHDEKGVPQHVLWTATRDHDGRGFGCTGAHYHWNWASDDFRKTVLNAIVWTAHIDVPKDGVPSKTPTFEELLANQDKKMPANFNREKFQKQVEGMNSAKTADAK
jgi:type 1 glutamine amidotransferase